MARPLEDKFLAAMIAVQPLPGSPLYAGDDLRILEAAVSDLEHYRVAGVDAIVLENSFDLPYIKPPLSERGIALMLKVAKAVRARFQGSVGIQMLEAANTTALQIAAEADLDFIRVEGYVFAHVGGAGIIEGCAGSLLRRRKELDCGHIKVFADVKKKHCSHALTADLDIVDVAKQSEFFLADGIVVTGARTAEAPDLNELKRVKESTELPVVIGSGMTQENISDYFNFADGFIVGSTFRSNGRFLAELMPERLHAFVEEFRSLASQA